MNEIIQSDPTGYPLNTWDISKSPAFQWSGKISQDKGPKPLFGCD